jgi:hypothetical protein
MMRSNSRAMASSSNGPRRLTVSAVACRKDRLLANRLADGHAVEALQAGDLDGAHRTGVQQRHQLLVHGVDATSQLTDGRDRRPQLRAPRSLRAR